MQITEGILLEFLTNSLEELVKNFLKKSMHISLKDSKTNTWNNFTTNLWDHSQIEDYPKKIIQFLYVFSEGIFKEIPGKIPKKSLKELLNKFGEFPVE